MDTELTFDNHTAASTHDVPLPEFVIHRGVEITLTARRKTYSYSEDGRYVYEPRDLYWIATRLGAIGGRRVQIAKAATIEQAIKKARKHVDVELLDDEQRSTVTKAMASQTGPDSPLSHDHRMDVLMRTTATMGMRTPEVGDRAWVWGMNRWRRGMVTKINKSRAEVAYTTPSSDGRIYRPVRPFADIWIEG